MREFSDRKNATTGIIILILIIILSFSVVIYDNTLKKQGIQIEPVNGRGIGYKNAKFSASGQYTSPGGSEEIFVTITLNNDHIQKAEVEGRAVNPTSKLYQKDFIDNFKQYVMGKNIDELLLDRVSGSSLTPKGFNEAIEKIKIQAKK